MRLSTIIDNNQEYPVIVVKQGVVPLTALTDRIGAIYQENLLTLIKEARILPLRDWFLEEHNWLNTQTDLILPFDNITYGPLYRHPNQIFGIGVNYMGQASALATEIPTDFPSSFFKPANTIIGNNDSIVLPKLSAEPLTTGEAELAVILGTEAKNIDEENWQDYIVGYTTALDMTEKSILLRNPRFMAIAKSFDTFFSFGPQLVTPDEVPDVSALTVHTILNGKELGRDTVNHMAFSPARQLALISQIQGWQAGDVLMTGTPASTPLQIGDTIECQITGPNNFSFEPLKNPVKA
ncbi:fumarylacetoacetate hydrolase family protein [Candidatus Enterococcus willemsii]|uniref:Fumarylacetoacetase-like C-terminal domain-containing protein n=1 Tax=Candidatus Enterococcus willemsii TaxID=1857215 RepID=A0ABQ6YXZ2_9ENTE|nr:fumarylacetoacetate hydrolase family protein [Enterococcus sp. CU12B]KAF1302554.1 hypothetical protein BAU17_02375 [Enterococcus sp. CU12B]